MLLQVTQDTATTDATVDWTNPKMAFRAKLPTDIRNEKHNVLFLKCGFSLGTALNDQIHTKWTDHRSNWRIN